MRELLDPLGLAMSLGFVVITLILGSLWLGLWIDRQLGTAPWGMLAFMLVGILTSTAAVYRLVASQYTRFSKSERPR